jgi:uncharacterized protein (TIGR02444 family)
MKTSRQFPQHPFWDYSLDLYGQPGVQDACLTLQDEFGLDVNLVLFCIWAGAEGPGKLETSELTECVARGRRWQTEVVERIRHIRRTLKQDDLGSSEELVKLFRPRAQRLELDAEHVEQLLLAGIVPKNRGDTGPKVVTANLDAYLALNFIEPNSAARELVALIVAKVF